jgi:hypothetical protein
LAFSEHDDAIKNQWSHRIFIERKGSTATRHILGSSLRLNCPCDDDDDDDKQLFAVGNVGSSIQSFVFVIIVIQKSPMRRASWGRDGEKAERGKTCKASNSGGFFVGWTRHGWRYDSLNKTRDLIDDAVCVCVLYIIYVIY